MHGEHVAGHANLVVLENVRFRVQDGVREACIRRGRTTPHAFADGVLVECSNSILSLDLESSDGIEVSYNRFHAGYFYNKATGEPIYSARLAVVTAKGALAFV